MNEIYAVFVKTSTHIPGDQRSRDYPGHGYPAYNLEKTEVIEFASKEKLLQWVENNVGYGKVSYRAFKCSSVQIRTTTHIDIE